MKKNKQPTFLCGEERQWEPGSSQHCYDESETIAIIFAFVLSWLSQAQTLLSAWLFGCHTWCFRKEERERRGWKPLSCGHCWTGETSQRLPTACWRCVGPWCCGPTLGQEELPALPAPPAPLQGEHRQTFTSRSHLQWGSMWSALCRALQEAPMRNPGGEPLQSCGGFPPPCKAGSTPGAPRSRHGLLVGSVAFLAFGLTGRARRWWLITAPS